jgi:hypothetical protein
MAIQDDTRARPTHSLNGFLRRWRRNASQAGFVTALLTSVLAALAVFAMCACKAIGSGRSFRR